MRQCKLSAGRLVHLIMSPRKSRAGGFALAAAALLAASLAAVASAETPIASDPLDLSGHHGQVVIVDFWASWCKPCRQSIPWLNSMRERYGARGLTIIGVNVDAEHHDAERFLRDVPIEFENVFDPGGELAKRFKVKGMPSSFVFDRAGELIETNLGFRDAKKDEHEATLKNLLNQPVK
jgi:thiol-disulfide isomerase/thioredoxin